MAAQREEGLKQQLAAAHDVFKVVSSGNLAYCSRGLRYPAWLSCKGVHNLSSASRSWSVR